MKLTSRSEYALLALVYLSRQNPEEYVSAETISLAQKIPLKFLEQILLTLRRAKYLYSSKGQRGGYRLAQSAEAIALAEVVRLFDGALAPTDSVSANFYESTPIEREEKLVQVFKDIRDYVSDKLERTTLADVV
ncbi:MAG: Rrf2 family transcriptional regulator [Anaerolineae bacterium]|nr:Rrf2 family transcriptional regulator [Anaerolineae bacterium]